MERGTCPRAARVAPSSPRKQRPSLQCCVESCRPAVAQLVETRERWGRPALGELVSPKLQLAQAVHAGTGSQRGRVGERERERRGRGGGGGTTPALSPHQSLCLAAEARAACSVLCTARLRLISVLVHGPGVEVRSSPSSSPLSPGDEALPSHEGLAGLVGSASELTLYLLTPAARPLAPAPARQTSSDLGSDLSPPSSSTTAAPLRPGPARVLYATYHAHCPSSRARGAGSSSSVARPGPPRPPASLWPLRQALCSVEWAGRLVTIAARRSYRGTSCEQSWRPVVRVSSRCGDRPPRQTPIPVERPACQLAPRRALSFCRAQLFSVSNR